MLFKLFGCRLWGMERGWLRYVKHTSRVLAAGFLLHGGVLINSGCSSSPDKSSVVPTAQGTPKSNDADIPTLVATYPIEAPVYIPTPQPAAEIVQVFTQEDFLKLNAKMNRPFYIYTEPKPFDVAINDVNGQLEVDEKAQEKLERWEVSRGRKLSLPSGHTLIEGEIDINRFFDIPGYEFVRLEYQNGGLGTFAKDISVDQLMSMLGKFNPRLGSGDRYVEGGRIPFYVTDAQLGDYLNVLVLPKNKKIPLWENSGGSSSKSGQNDMFTVVGMYNSETLVLSEVGKLRKVMEEFIVWQVTLREEAWVTRISDGNLIMHDYGLVLSRYDVPAGILKRTGCNNYYRYPNCMKQEC